MSVTYLVTLTGLQCNSDFDEVMERVSKVKSVVSVEFIDLAKDSRLKLLSPFNESSTTHCDFWAGFTIGCKSTGKPYILVNVGDVLGNLDYDEFEENLRNVKNIDNILKAKLSQSIEADVTLH